MSAKVELVTKTRVQIVLWVWSQEVEEREWQQWGREKERVIIKVTSVDNGFLISLEPLSRGQNTFLKVGSLEQLFSII